MGCMVGHYACPLVSCCFVSFFFFQAEDGIRDLTVTGVQTCALPICSASWLDVGSPGTAGSCSLATNLVGATSSTTRSFGVGNSTSNVSIWASSPKLLNFARIHSALALSYGEPT